MKRVGFVLARDFIPLRSYDAMPAHLPCPFVVVVVVQAKVFFTCLSDAFSYPHYHMHELAVPDPDAITPEPESEKARQQREQREQEHPTTTSKPTDLNKAWYGKYPENGKLTLAKMVEVVEALPHFGKARHVVHLTDGSAFAQHQHHKPRNSRFAIFNACHHVDSWLYNPHGQLVIGPPAVSMFNYSLTAPTHRPHRVTFKGMRSRGTANGYARQHGYEAIRKYHNPPHVVVVSSPAPSPSASHHPIMTHHMRASSRWPSSPLPRRSWRSPVPPGAPCGAAFSSKHCRSTDIDFLFIARLAAALLVSVPRVLLRGCYLWTIATKTQTQTQT